MFYNIQVQKQAFVNLQLENQILSLIGGKFVQLPEPYPTPNIKKL